MNVLVNNIPVYYRDEGNGPVILMLHGWGSDLTTFNNLSTWSRDNYRVVRLDLPGFGKTSFTSDSAWHLDDYVEFINDFLRKLEISQVNVLVGHSMGGRIAIKGVAEGKLKTNQLILLASHGLSERSVRKLLYTAVAKIGKAVTIILPHKVRNKLRKKLYKSAGSQDYLQASPEMKATFKAIINEDLRQTASQIKVPTLLIYGTKDDQTPLQMGEVFAGQIKGSVLKVIKDAGHFLHLDSFDEVTKAIKEFLS